MSHDLTTWPKLFSEWNHILKAKTSTDVAPLLSPLCAQTCNNLWDHLSRSSSRRHFLRPAWPRSFFACSCSSTLFYSFFRLVLWRQCTSAWKFAQVGNSIPVGGFLTKTLAVPYPVHTRCRRRPRPRHAPRANTRARHDGILSILILSKSPIWIRLNLKAIILPLSGAAIAPAAGLASLFHWVTPNRSLVCLQVDSSKVLASLFRCWGFWHCQPWISRWLLGRCDPEHMLAAKIVLLYFFKILWKMCLWNQVLQTDHSSSAPSTPSSVDRMVEEMIGVSPGAGGIQITRSTNDSHWFCLWRVPYGFDLQAHPRHFCAASSVLKEQSFHV